MPPHQVLPFDVLLLILEMVPQSTAAKMTRTCNTLRQRGARSVLDHGVSLTSGDSIVSFVQFLYADAAGRFQHFRSLEIACGTIPPPAVDALLGMILHPSLALDSLMLQDGNESVLDSPPSPSFDATHDAPQSALVTALAGLTTIRHLKIRGHCGRAACSLLQALRSPLKTIFIDFPLLHGQFSVDDLRRRNPILTLANHSDTLEEISGSHLIVFPLQIEGLFETVYPSVHTLNVSFNDTLPSQTLQLITAFPNLRRLAISPPGGRPVLSPESHDGARLVSAMRNRLWQGAARHNRTPIQWTKLEELEGSLSDILSLGPSSSHIPMLRLIGTLCGDSLGYAPVKLSLELALQDTEPLGLAIAVACPSTFGVWLGPVFRRPFVQQLRVLEMELVFSASEGDVDVQVILNEVAAMLIQAHALHRLTLTLNYGLLATPEEPHRLQHGCSCPVQRDIESLDVVAAQTLFRAAIPSLEMDAVVRVSTDRPSYT